MSAEVEIYTSRFLNYDLLSSGVVVPVRISMFAPQQLLGELPYELKYSVRALQPERHMIGEWPRFSSSMWAKLNSIGVENIATQLAAISGAEGGKSLALLCFEDVTRARGHRCHRVVVSLWWLEQTGYEIPELTNDGEVLSLHKLHRQTAPVVPKEPP
jgi:hypothetical protein